jgi:hypothetical protein
MKKQMSPNLRNVASKMFLPALLASVLLFNGVSNSLHAQNTTATYSKPAIRYVGKTNDQLVFQVDFDNINEEIFNLAIKDEDGNLLYTDRFKDKKFSKKFKVDQAGYGNMKLTFVLTTDKEKQTQVFQVNTNTRVVDDVVVTNL